MPAAASQIPQPLQELLREYELAKAAYDDELVEVLDMGKQAFDAARLAARKRLREKGFRDPDVIRWELRARLGFYPTVEEGE